MKKEKQFTLSTKGEKIFRWCMIAFDLAIMLAGVGMAIYYKQIGDPNNRFLASLSMLMFGLIPFVYELISRGKIPNTVFLLFNIYLLIAGFLGAALNGYNTFSWLDIVVHFIMGYLVAAIGLFILCRSKQNTKMHYLLVALFCLCFSLFVETIWEVCEWTVDNIAGQAAQGVPVEGLGAPLVTDTMEDICCNLGGAMLFFFHFLISKWTKKNLLIGAMEKEFSIKHKLFEKNKKINNNLANNTEENLQKINENLQENNSAENSEKIINNSSENNEKINDENNNPPENIG